MNEKLICEHISVSRKQTWSECQQKYKYKYHLKLPEQSQPYFIYGKVIHKIAEIYVQEQGKRPIEEISRDCLKGKIEVESSPGLGSTFRIFLPSQI